MVSAVLFGSANVLLVVLIVWLLIDMARAGWRD
jgi:hypothetical protein